jgi:hypothetical protein
MESTLQQWPLKSDTKVSADSIVNTAVGQPPMRDIKALRQGKTVEMSAA